MSSDYNRDKEEQVTLRSFIVAVLVLLLTIASFLFVDCHYDREALTKFCTETAKHTTNLPDNCDKIGLP